MSKSNLEILRRVVLEEAIKASKEYGIKEKVREDLQTIIINRVQSGEIKDEKSLREFWNTLEMSIKTLKMVPIEVLKNIKNV